MALILSLETATDVCSVALAGDEGILGIRESNEPNVHSVFLTTCIREVLEMAGCRQVDLDAVAVSMGPGSYTGLRIGVAAAKGLCYAIDRPLIAVPTLQAMAAGMTPSLPSPGGGGFGDRVCPMIDARRMEVYCALYDAVGRELREVRAEIVDGSSFGEFLSAGRVIFGGSGAEKCREVLGGHPNAIFLSGFRASARFMAGLALERFRAGQFEDLAYFEPFYLKDFVAAKPVVKGLK